MEIHCHRCGGFIGNPGGTMYLAASAETPPIAPHSGLCGCDQPLVYGTAPEPETGIYHYLRSASRN